MDTSFIINKKDNIKYGIFKDFLSFNVIAATSLREGGVSDNPYFSLNLAFHVGDNSRNVIENRKLFFNALNINYKDIISLKQIHSDRIFLVTKNDIGKGALNYESSLNEGDGLVTIEKNIPLVILTADCLPIFFFEKEKKIIGIVHSGWKGTYLDIVSKMVDKIVSLGGKIENIIVGLGPGIEGKCYEVGEEFLSRFDKKYLEKINEKYYLDLYKINVDKLLMKGISKGNIFESKMCTFCEEDKFFSYRREKITGRMASVIMAF